MNPCPIATKVIRLTLLITLFFCTHSACLAQKSSLLELQQLRQIQTRRGMYVLGGWAVGNMVWGGIGMATTTGRTRGFHEMNLAWNTVNLGLAALSFIQAKNQDETLSAWDNLDDHVLLEKAFLFNTALDLAYVAGGFYMIERSKNGGWQPDRLNGWGTSLLLQGGFLFAFDLTMYLVLHRSYSQYEQFLSTVQVSPAGFRVTLPIGR